MKPNYQDGACGQLAESDDDVIIEGMILDESPPVEPGERMSRLEDSHGSYTLPFSRKKIELLDISEEDSNDYYAASEAEMHVSLNLYFKAVSTFPLLSREEEIGLVKRIKESEYACENLVMQCKTLFNDESAKICICKNRKDGGALNDSLKLVKDLTTWEERRERIVRLLQNRTLKLQAEKALQEKLHRIKTEISKCITRISRDRAFSKGMLGAWKNGTQGAKNIRRQQQLERDLINILESLSHCAQHMRQLKTVMVQSNLRLVISIAKRYTKQGLALSDLIQEGNIGLMRAVDTYDYRKDARLVTYATWWIKQAMVRALECHSSTIRKPAYINEKLSQIFKVSHRLRMGYEREPTVQEIAEEMNIPVQSIEKIMYTKKDFVSWDALIEENCEDSADAALRDTFPSALDKAVSSDLSRIVDGMLSDVTPKKREIIKLRFGMGDNDTHTLEAIGKKFNMSRERVRQIIEEGLSALTSSKKSLLLKPFLIDH